MSGCGFVATKSFISYLLLGNMFLTTHIPLSLEMTLKVLYGRKEMIEDRSFTRAFNLILKYEGGYADHPLDMGGATCYGISSAFLKANNINKDVKTLTVKDAKQIYRMYFWEVWNMDRFTDDGVKLFLFDTSVNCGIGTAAICLQRAISMFEDIKLDGIVGNQTVTKCNRLSENNRSRFLDMLIHFRKQYYCEIVKSKPVQRVFMRGWLDRSSDLLEQMWYTI